MGNDIVTNPQLVDDPFGPKPSITNIIGMRNKEFLPPYYAKLVAEYAVGNIVGLENTIRRFGPKVAIGQLKAIVNQPNAAAQIGDEVHAAVDSFIKTKGNDEPPVFTTITAARMYEQWLYFITQIPIKILHSEFTVWSYKHGYAGTGDVMFELEHDFFSPQGTLIPKGVWLGDWKSGNNVYPEVALQTAALTEADVILDSEGHESPMPKIDVQGVIHIRPRSVKLHRLERTTEAFKAFLACKQLFDWNRFDREFVMQEPFRTEIPKGV